jgi:hypothetical protein
MTTPIATTPTPTKSRKPLSPRVVFLLHLSAFAVAVKGASVLNRTWMPAHGWWKWLAIAWGVFLGLHLLYLGVLELLALRGHDPT